MCLHTEPKIIIFVNLQMYLQQFHIFFFCLLISVSGFAGDKDDYLNETETLRLQLNEDNTYRLILIDGKNKHGKVYDKIGYWKEEKGVITLYFTGYDMGSAQKLEIDYKGCDRIEKKPIAEYKYRKKGAKLKSLNPQKKDEIFIKTVKSKT
jgi:hypothetical protein